MPILALGLAAYLWPKTALAVGALVVTHKAWPALMFNLANK